MLKELSPNFCVLERPFLSINRHLIHFFALKTQLSVTKHRAHHPHLSSPLGSPSATPSSTPTTDSPHFAHSPFPTIPLTSSPANAPERHETRLALDLTTARIPVVSVVFERSMRVEVQLACARPVVVQKILTASKSVQWQPNS